MSRRRKYKEWLLKEDDTEKPKRTIRWQKSQQSTNEPHEDAAPGTSGQGTSFIPSVDSTVQPDEQADIPTSDECLAAEANLISSSPETLSDNDESAPEYNSMDSEATTDSSDSTNSSSSEHCDDIDIIEHETVTELEHTEEETMDNSNTQGENSLFEGSKVSERQSRLLILSYVLRHNISDVATSDLLKLLNCHLPTGTILKHKSLHLMYKRINLSEPSEHYYCGKENCQTYFGTLAGAISCRYCKKEFSLDFLKKNKKYFLYLSIKEQLLQILNNSNLMKEIQIHKRNKSQSSLINGKLYMRLQSSGLIKDDDITLQFNTDGAEAQKSPSKSVWPLQVGINELPLRLRTRYTMLNALWFENNKPEMNNFMKPFVAEMCDLAKFGLTLNNGKKIKVYCINCPVDTVARAMLQKVHSHRGKNGCSFCLMLGAEIAVGRGFARKYIGTEFEKRSLQQHIDDLKIVMERGEVINGILEPSELMKIPLFDITCSFSLDYLHALCAGVLKLLFCAFLSDDYKSHDFNISNLRDEINSDFLKITPCCEITRVPQTLENLKHFKAAEFKNLGIHYALPLLKNRLQKKYLDLLFLFLFVLKSLLSERISKDLLSTCRKAAIKFVKGVNLHLGPKFMTINVHFVLHLCDYVEEYGALFDSSTFPYEAFNGFLLGLFHGTVALPDQIFRSFQRAKYLQQQQDIGSGWECSEAEELFLSLVDHKSKTKNCKVISEKLVVFGAEKPVVFNDIEKNQLQDLLQISVNEGLEVQRFLFDGVLIHTEAYERMQKRNNHTIRLNDGKLLSIKKCFLVLVQNKYRCVLFGCVLKELSQVIASDSEIKINSKLIVQMVNPADTVSCHDVTTFKNKVVCFSIQDNMYVSDLPNRFERD